MAQQDSIEKVSIEEVEEMFERMRENIKAELLNMYQINLDQFNPIQIDRIQDAIFNIQNDILDTLTGGEENFILMITIWNANPEFRKVFCNGETHSWETHPYFPQVQEAFYSNDGVYDDNNLLVLLCCLMQNMYELGLESFETECINIDDIREAILENNVANLIRIHSSIKPIQ